MVKHREPTEKPVAADNKPIKIQLKAGKYFWCACGHSKKQPFCDGSHYGTGIRPVRFVTDKDREAYLCMCKQTKNPPFCDGSHNHQAEK